MKKLALVLLIALFVNLLAISPGFGEDTYGESPLLTPLVESGELPPVEERLPNEPKLAYELLPEQLEPEIGNYGGTQNSATTTPNTDLTVFVGLNEALLTTVSVNSGEITGNILKGYEVNDDNTEFTLYLREGLKWSDGAPVTMEDFLFTFNNVINNTELTPVFPAKLRSGGKSDGTPCTYEVIDDWTLKVTFDSSYGGFLVSISIAGWVGYTDFLKPAHYLKPFHIDYAEECHGSIDAYYEYIAPFADKIGYDDPKAEGVWTYVFNYIDMTNWEDTNPNYALTSQYFEGLIDTNFPVLYPYVMESTAGNITTWVRNPYYFKVDAEGNQLPYIDYVTSTLYESLDVQYMDTITGRIDYRQGDISEYSLLKENDKDGGYNVYLTTYHNTPTDIMVNVNYGLNNDGTVKDDADAIAWQDVVNDVRFRKALTLAIDADEIIDTIYLGFAEKNTRYPCNADIDAANDLLDEMGMVDIDGDGYRETPNGYALAWQIWNANEANDIIPVCELLVEYWREIGLNVSVYTTENSLLTTSQEANEIPMRVCWIHETQLWHYFDWGDQVWAPMWYNWYQAGGLNNNPAAEGLLEPTESYKELRRMIESLNTETPEVAANEIMPQIADIVAEEMFLIVPLTNVGRLMVVDDDIGNIPTGGLAFAWNMNYELIYYHNPDQAH